MRGKEEMSRPLNIARVISISLIILGLILFLI